MNILIIILIILGSLVTLFLIIALLTNKECRIEKQTVVNKPKQEVFNYVKLLKNQEKYSVWVMKDPNINLVYSGTDGTVGATSSWTSNDKNVGVGAQEIIKLADGESMDVEIKFEKPFKATNYANTTVTTTGDGQTKVSHVFTGRAKFPMNIMNLFMDKLVGRDMQRNLDNVKMNLEK